MLKLIHIYTFNIAVRVRVFYYTCMIIYRVSVRVRSIDVKPDNSLEGFVSTAVKAVEHFFLDFCEKFFFFFFLGDPIEE